MKNSQSTELRVEADERPMAKLFGGAVLACKITELVLACTSMGLHLYVPPIPIDDAVVILIPFGAYIIIISGMLLGHLIGERIPWKIDLFFTVIGIFIFVAAGEVAEKYYIDCIYKKDSNVLDAIVGTGAWIMVIVLFGDSIMVYKNISIEVDGRHHSKQKNCDIKE